MQFDDLFSDGKTKAGAFLFLGIDSEKFIEDLLAVILRDPRSCISNLKADLSFVSFQLDDDSSTFRSIFDSIA